LYHENLGVAEHGYYVEAKDLKVGEVFIGANGELTTLTETYREEFSNGITVYNFTVADNHNYFVIANVEAYENGASVVLVHNAKRYGNYPEDIRSDDVKNLSAYFNSEREARNYAFQKLGKKPVYLGENKYRSRDGVWQYRAHPTDLTGHNLSDTAHIHLEKLNPKTGVVIKNIHLRFPIPQ
jgi:hypothetical protein